MCICNFFQMLHKFFQAKQNIVLHEADILMIRVDLREVIFIFEIPTFHHLLFQNNMQK